MSFLFDEFDCWLALPPVGLRCSFLLVGEARRAGVAKLSPLQVRFRVRFERATELRSTRLDSIPLALHHSVNAFLARSLISGS